MSCLTTQEANLYLQDVGMCIGAWNQITHVDAIQAKTKWVSYQAPQHARELYIFSQYVSGWLPKGSWKICQIDNSTSLDAIEAALVNGLLGGTEQPREQIQHDWRSFLFQFVEPGIFHREVALSNLTYALLLLDCHAQLVSAGSSNAELVSIQDGFVYFIARDDKPIAAAEATLSKFRSNPLMAPQWVLELPQFGA